MQWHFADENPPPSPSAAPETRSRKVWWLLLPLLLILLLVAWQINKRQERKADEALLQNVRAQFALEQEAYARGDGELFWANQAADGAWFAAQLNPLNQLIYLEAATVSAATQHGALIWANLTWTGAHGEPLQRVAFYEEQQDGRLLRVPTDPAFWGGRRSANYEWGQLTLFEADQEWGATIDAYVQNAIWEICARNCLSDRLPLQISIATDFEPGVVPGQLRVPSPHLLALDEQGMPAPLFWDQLRAALVDQLTPATIRFAMGDDKEALQKYHQAAQAFMAQNPHIRVEIVMLDDEYGRTNFEDLDLALINSFDAIAFTPTAALLATGVVRDLTPYMTRDPTFDRADFYEQVWQGVFWHERAWFVPQAARMPLLYYDKTAFENAAQPEPSLRWTWAEMATDMAATAVPEAEVLHRWGFLEPESNALFSYAYSWDNQCTRNTILCDQPLTETAVSAALTWYVAMVRETELHPDITQFEANQEYATSPYFLPISPSNIRNNWQSARRRAVIWVDTPADYEFRRLLAPMGVVPFPGSDRFDGITPLWVYGHFITQGTERPLATWQWLDFLSYYPLQMQHRYVPARPSLAAATHFWQTLPHELDNVMRTAFPFARPVLIAEQDMFGMEQITSVLAGVDPEIVASRARSLIWFTQP